MVLQAHVALIIETSSIYGRRILQGITRYLQLHQSWSIFLEQRELDAVPPRWLKTWRGDGIISHYSNPQTIEALRRAKRGVVDLSDRRPSFGPVRINSDNVAVGRLGAEHLLGRGFRHFAFCGFEHELWATRRWEGFLEVLMRAGYTGIAFESPWVGPDARPWEQEQLRIGRWLKSLPKPIGVMACNDLRGLHILDACRRCDLKVPEEVAVIGVGDDALLCEICNPPLSSIISNPEQIGYEAAALLDRLMAGEEAGFAEKMIPPIGIVSRLSTDVLSIDDAHFADAVRYIRANACRGITVDDVLERIPLSRSTLERRFRKYLGHSPQAEIRAVQLGRVKQLLAETDYPLHLIAELTGFVHPEYLNVVFKRELGRPRPVPSAGEGRQ